MSLVDEVTFWRDPDNWDDPPTEEMALDQMVFGVLLDFIEEQGLLISDQTVGEFLNKRATT